MIASIKRLGTLCAISAALTFAQAENAKSAKDSPSRDAVECTARGGLPNFFAKLKAGKDVKIAYLGGSITAQNGWRVLSREWFQKQYPKAKVEGIHAAIGGTGSNLGVFRVERDVLVKKPDLLFIEFAVNDGGASPEQIRKSMEGIIRKTWKALPDCDICFVYTITARDIKGLQQGKMKRSASTMEEIADFYNIPTIHMGIEAAKLEKEGKLVMKAQMAEMDRVSGDALNVSSKVATDEKGRICFSKDGVHPYTNTGHVLYMKAIIRSMDKIKDTGKTGPHKVGEAQTPGNWEGATIVPLTKAQMTGSWTKLDPKKDKLARTFQSRLPELWKAEPGAALKFKFKGTKAAIYQLIGPGCGYLEVNVDGKKRKVKAIDRYCTYYRLSTMNLLWDGPDGMHDVEIKVLPDEIDKSKVLFKRNLGDLEKNPKKYEKKDWYAGAIFLIGEIK